MKISRKKSSVEVNVRNASDFVKALGEGASPEDAALSVGQTLKSLMRDPGVISNLEGLMNYHFPKAEHRKAIVIARNMKIVIEGEDRDATAASRVLAMDPELGLVSNQGPLIEIRLSDDLSKMEPGNPFKDETLERDSASNK